MRTITTRLAVAAVAVLALAGPASAEPVLTVTSPAAGDTVSRSATPQLAIAGTAAFDAPEATETKYFLRQNVCSNASTDTRSLSTTFSTSDAASCGYNGFITPMNEVFNTIDGQPALTIAFPMEDVSLPITLDASRPIAGVLRVSSFSVNGVAVGAGLAVVDVRLTGTVGGMEQALGSTTVEYQALPGSAAGTDVAWSINPDATLDKKDVSTLNLEVTIRGMNALHGWLNYRGLSHLTIPRYTTSFTPRVEVAIGTGAFSATGVTLSPETGTWTATRPTPAVGAHVIKARAVQGGSVSATQEIAIQVTA